MSFVKLQIIALATEYAYIPAKEGKKIVQLHEILQIGLHVVCDKYGAISWCSRLNTFEFSLFHSSNSSYSTNMVDITCFFI